ncbi:MAG: molybdopterin molybdotransferase [Brevundimonas sp.]|jgi:molybdopterin molybdotransferase|uniref:molybdopterin molybdotransferase MoeA n=1 Tax=Brevundimonas sp. TaxID=1871086 RepID=UPI0039E6ABD0
MTLPDVETARTRMLEAVRILESESVFLDQVDGRWLAEPIAAMRDQPPFDAAAMDGYAVRGADVAPGARLKIVGESAAGGRGALRIGPGEAVRIFTGAALPEGADSILIQEVVTREGEGILLGDQAPDPAHRRPRGVDFRAGDRLLAAGVRLNPWRIALAASAGAAAVSCARRPRVAILPGGDELAVPGAPIEAHQIHDSAGPALTAFVRRWGGAARTLRPVQDDDGAIRDRFEGLDVDLVVTIGGASVGDHDRMKPALRSLGAELTVEGCAVRPGKPVWCARLPDGRLVLGLPGNPASALVCAELFLAPLLVRLQGGIPSTVLETAILNTRLPANGPREHYMRARLLSQPDGTLRVLPFSNQDSSLVTVMAEADGLVRRPAGADPASPGAVVQVLRPA